MKMLYFFYTTYVRLFLITVFTVLFAVLVQSLFQFASTEKLFVDKIKLTIAQNSNELLNEVALSDYGSVMEHLSIIKKQLDLDGLSIRTKDYFYDNIDIGGEAQKPIELEISDKFKQYPIHLNVFYKRSFYKSKILYLFYFNGLLCVILLACIAIMFYVLFIKIKNKIFTPLIGMTRFFEGKSNLDEVHSDLYEIKKMKDAFERFQEIERQKKEQEIELYKSQAISVLASQTSHDIRSPLHSLLESFRTWVHLLPEPDRILVRSVITRIDDIANGLMSKYKNNQVDENKETIEPQLLATSISEIASEKRMENSGNIIVESFSDNVCHIFSSINVKQFKRVLSNIINNAIDSYDSKKAYVKINLSSDDFNSVITITDEGKGIPSGILNRLGKEVITYGKHNNPTSGSGLGILHAKKTIESWGGTFSIDSTVGFGTKVTISILRTKVPVWFSSEVELKNEMAIVVLDDDSGIHKIWERKILLFVSVFKLNIKIFNCFNPNDFREWVNRYRSNFRDVLYLCDYELNGFSETGLDLLESCEINEGDAILVTSYFEYPDIRERCSKNNVKLLPKMLMDYVQLIEKKEINKTHGFVVFISTIGLVKVHEFLLKVSEELNVEYRLFENYRSFVSFKDNVCARKIICFVDKHILDNSEGLIEQSLDTKLCVVLGEGVSLFDVDVKNDCIVVPFDRVLRDVKSIIEEHLYSGG